MRGRILEITSKRGKQMIHINITAENSAIVAWLKLIMRRKIETWG